MNTDSNLSNNSTEDTRLGGVAIIARSILMKTWLAGISLSKEDAQWLDDNTKFDKNFIGKNKTVLESAIYLAAFDDSTNNSLNIYITFGAHDKQLWTLRIKETLYKKLIVE